MNENDLHTAINTLCTPDGGLTDESRAVRELLRSIVNFRNTIPQAIAEARADVDHLLEEWRFALHD